MRLDAFVVLDLETTGLTPERGDRIIEVAAIKVRNGVVVEEFTSLIHPGMALSRVISAITGITDEDLVGAPSFDEKQEELIAFLEDLPIMGHNIGFDIKFLTVEGCDMTKHVPLDTFELAALFLPGRDSYALDVLSAQLSLTQGTHRALDDVYASYDLFLHIQKEFLTLAPAIQQALSMLIQRSSWKGNILFPVSSQEEVPLEETLFGLLDTLLPHLQYGFSLSLTEKEQQFFAEEWFEEAKTVLTGTSTLLDVPLGIHYAKQLCIGMVARPTDTQHYFAFQNERLLGLLLEQLPCAGGAGASVLMKDREPHHFLSLKRLRASLAQSHFSSEHGTMLLKIFFAFATGQTNGLKESIKLVREEQALWPLVACGESDMQDSEELFLQAYLRERAQVPVLLGTHHLALKHLGRNQFPLERRLSFLQGQHLGKSMSFASKHEVQLSRLLGISAFLSALTYGAPAHVEERLAQYALDLEGKSTMLFGLLGVWFQKDAAPSVQENTLTFAPHLATLLSWVPVKSLLEKILLLCEEIALFLEQELPFFVDAYHGQIEEVKILFPLFITEETPALRKIQLLGDDGFAFVTFTPETTERVRHTLTQLPAFFFFAHGLTLTDPQGKSLPTPLFSYLLPFPTQVVYRFATAPAHDTLLLIPSDIPEPNNPAYYKETALLIFALCRHFQGKVLGLFSSRHVLEKNFSYLYPLLKQEDIHAYVEGMSGSLGKILYKYLKDQEKSVLLGTNMLLDHLTMEELEVHCVLIQKLPFGPYLEGVPLPTEATTFMASALPVMLTNLASMLSHALATTNERVIITLLDKRALSAQYGKILRATLEASGIHMTDVPQSQMKETLVNWIGA